MNISTCGVSIVSIVEHRAECKLHLHNLTATTLNIIITYPAHRVDLRRDGELQHIVPRRRDPRDHGSTHPVPRPVGPEDCDDDQHPAGGPQLRRHV